MVVTEPALEHASLEAIFSELIDRLGRVEEKVDGLLATQKRGYVDIYNVVKEIPPGRVATYKQIADILGHGYGPIVGYAMAAAFRNEVPWHRVVNRQGDISGRADRGSELRQHELLTKEGVLFDQLGRVILDRVRWEGPS